MSISIREITMDDVASYARLRTEMVQKYPTVFNVYPETVTNRDESDWRRDVSRFVDNSNQKRFIAEDSSNAVGVIGCVICCETVEIGGFYVKPNYQNQGVGRQLMQKALDFASDSLCETAGLWVSDSGNFTKDWYNRLGFCSLYPPEIVQHDVFPEIKEEYLVLNLKK